MMDKNNSTYNSGGGGSYACTEIPDYYLGCLVYYDEFGLDNCRWVVYDGHAKVRCPTRKDAVDYIATHRLKRDEQITRLLLSARLLCNRACDELQQAARSSSGTEQLLYDRLAVRLKPIIVDLDNILV